MKHILVILIVSLVFVGCKTDSKEGAIKGEASGENVEANLESLRDKSLKQNDGLTTFSGQFVYFADAAVLQAKNEIYGVVINEKMHELAEMAKAYKKEDTDYVSVQIRGKLIPKQDGEEGWPYSIDIKEIENVTQYESKENEVIRLGNSQS